RQGVAATVRVTTQQIVSRSVQKDMISPAEFFAKAGKEKIFPSFPPRCSAGHNWELGGVLSVIAHRKLPDNYV
ncbi:MAG: hypothetical protein WC952_14315, partial [Desulfobulbaceae bacterium]